MRHGNQITIDGGNVEAIGGTAAAAIGSGASAQGHSTDITVKNNVDVLAKDGVFTEWWSSKTGNINASDLGDNGLVSITRNPEENPSQLIYKSGDSVRVNTAAKYVSSTNATCTAPGTVTYRLSTGEERTLTRGGAPALGHSFSNYQSDGDATCTQDGHKSAKCDHCDAVDVVADPGSKLDHSFTNYVSDNNATCLSDGTKTALCDRGCGEKKTVQDVGSQLSHSFTKYTPDATGETETALCDNGCGTKDTRLHRGYGPEDRGAARGRTADFVSGDGRKGQPRLRHPGADRQGSDDYGKPGQRHPPWNRPVPPGAAGPGNRNRRLQNKPGDLHLQYR